MTMYVSAAFTTDGVPATGLTPTLRIRRVDTGALVVTDAAMTEVGDGAYYYTFAAHDPLLDYSVRCDGGVAQPTGERYTDGVISTADALDAAAVTTAVPTAAAAGTDAASKVLATPANKLVTDTSGRVDLVDAPNATALAAIWAVATRTLTAISDSTGVTTLLARLSAARAGYLDFLAGWTTTIFAQIAGIVWGHTSRTLTQSAAVTAAQVAGANITVLRGDSMSAAITGLGNLSAYVSLDFTVKAGVDDADSAAIIRIRKNLSGTGNGLLVLNSATAATPADGSITIDDATLGNITIALKAVDTAQLDIGLAAYDVQMITATGVTTLTSGSFTVTSDVTRAIT